MKNVIINGKVILENSIKELNVFFEDGKITEVSNRTPTDENVIDAERHIADLIYMQGSKVKKLSNNVIEVKLDEDYTMLIIKQKRGSKC